MPVRRKLLLLSAAPVGITGAVLLALFRWSTAELEAAHEEARAWEAHAQALRHLDTAAWFYFDNVADSVARDPMPHEAKSTEVLARTRADALALSRRFPVGEQLEHRMLDASLGAFVEQGNRVDGDPERLAALESTYRDVIGPEILVRVQEEVAGRERALNAANKLDDQVRTGAFVVALGAVLITVGASAFAVRGFGARVASLDEAASRVAAGHLEEKVPVTSTDELGRLAGSINAMIEALRRQRTRQLGFLAAVAHDLKNPLAPMRLAGEGLLQGERLPPEPAVRKALTVIDKQIDRLARMADDLLDATSIEAGELKLSLGVGDLAAMARDVIELYEGASPRHDLHLSAPAEPVPCVCDPTRIAQVLDNLVSNAIKYSPGGGSIDVTVTPGTHEEVTCSVSDHGPGIEPDEYDSIFEPFRRVSPTKNVAAGVGLGLSTSRRIVTAHGGRIAVNSEIGRGTTFTVHLPRGLPRSALQRRRVA